MYDTLLLRPAHLAQQCLRIRRLWEHRLLPKDHRCIIYTSYKHLPTFQIQWLQRVLSFWGRPLVRVWAFTLSYKEKKSEQMNRLPLLRFRCFSLVSSNDVSVDVDRFSGSILSPHLEDFLYLGFNMWKGQNAPWPIFKQFLCPHRQSKETPMMSTLLFINMWNHFMSLMSWL